MKRLLFALPCLLILGCLDLSMGVKMKADWSSSYVLEVEMLDQMYQLILAQGQQSGMDVSLFNKDSFEAMAKENGGRLNRFSNEVKDGTRKILMDAWFPDARKLWAELGQGMVTLVEQDGVWTMRIMDNEMANTASDLKPEVLEQQLASMKPMMVGLKFKITVSVPELVSTNLTRKDNTTAVYVLDFDTDIAPKTGMEAVEAFKSLMAPKEVRFKGMKGS